MKAEATKKLVLSSEFWRRAKILTEVLEQPFQMTKMLGDGEQPTLPWALQYWDQTLHTARTCTLDPNWERAGVTSDDLGTIYDEVWQLSGGLPLPSASYLVSAESSCF